MNEWGTWRVGGKSLKSCVITNRLLPGGRHRSLATATSHRHCPGGRSEARFWPRTGVTRDCTGLGVCSLKKASRLQRTEDSGRCTVSGLPGAGVTRPTVMSPHKDRAGGSSPNPGTCFLTHLDECLSGWDCCPLFWEVWGRPCPLLRGNEDPGKV